MKLQKLAVQHWRQFQRIEIEFSNRMTVLTGANGAGKSTLLNLISRHYGWGFLRFVSLPTYLETGQLNYVTGLWGIIDPSNESQSNSHQGSPLEIGEFTYSDGSVSKLQLPRTVDQSEYDVGFSNMRSLKGLHIPSHRPVPSRKAVQSIPTQPKGKDQVCRELLNTLACDYQSSYSEKRPNYIMKETIISWGAFGYGNQVVRANDESRRAFERFQTVLSRILPPTLGFERLTVQLPDLIIETKTGNFTFDAMSGGIGALVDLAWQIVLNTTDEGDFVVTIDEPENHLHPRMQRSVLPDLLRAFPNVQFIIATHNPFVVSSVPDANVYVLNYNEANRVESQKLDFIDRLSTANDILREVLGVPVTMPIWVEERIEEVVRKYAELELTSETLKGLRSELSNLGFDELLPETIARVARRDGEKHD